MCACARLTALGLSDDSAWAMLYSSAGAMPCWRPACSQQARVAPGNSEQPATQTATALFNNDGMSEALTEMEFDGLLQVLQAGFGVNQVSRARRARQGHGFRSFQRQRLSKPHAFPSGDARCSVSPGLAINVGTRQLLSDDDGNAGGGEMIEREMGVGVAVHA